MVGSLCRNLPVAVLLLALCHCSCASPPSQIRTRSSDGGSSHDPRLLAQLVPEDDSDDSARTATSRREGSADEPAYERINGVWRVADIRQPPPQQQQQQHPPQQAALQASLQGFAGAPKAAAAQQRQQHPAPPKLFVDFAASRAQPVSKGRAQPQPQAAVTAGLGLGGGFLQQQLQHVVREQQQQQQKPAAPVGALAGEALTGGLFWAGARQSVNAFNASFNPDSDFLIPRGVGNRVGPSATVRVADSPAAAEFGSQTNNVLVMADVSTNGAIVVTASVIAAAPEASQGMRLTLSGRKLSTFTSVRLLNSSFGASSGLSATLANATVTLSVARINTTAVRTFQVVLQLSQCEPGSGPCCNRDYQFEAAGTVCRPAAHSCDVADVCSGHSVECGNALAADGAVCVWAMPTVDPSAAPFAGGLAGRRSVRRFSTQPQLGSGPWPPALSRNEAGPAQQQAAAEAAGVTMCRGTCMRGVCRIQVGPSGSCVAAADDDDADARPVQRPDRHAPSPWDSGRQQRRW